jgi:Ca2+/Na+ antiporter
LTYKPAYVGLFLSLFLAAVCNTFLDIQYGGFAFETLFWAITFGATIRIGWRQQGEVSEKGRKAQKTVLIVGALMSALIFVPMWGFPRAGLAILAMLQATQNCVTVNRRSLHLGLLVSIVMVMFAASHHRADWTMLFYLVPYVVAVVFALVAEQISRRAQDLRRESLSHGSSGGQGVAIGAATVAILMGGVILYSITPQVTWPYLYWRYGQPGSIGFLGNAPGQGQKPGDRGSGGSGMPIAGQAGQEGGPGGGPGEGELRLPGGAWPSPQEMRKAAKRKGMPEWQSSVIVRMAEVAELTQVTLTPIKLGIEELLNDIKEWLAEHRQAIVQALMSIVLLALLLAAWLLLREVRLVLWLRSRFDYLRLGLLRWHAPGNVGALQFYEALERLMDVQGTPRVTTANTREFMAQVSYRYRHLRREMVEMIVFFERARYGGAPISSKNLEQVHRNYKTIFARIGRLD